MSDLAVQVLPALTPLITTMFGAFALGAASLPQAAIGTVEALRDVTSAFTDMIGNSLNEAAKFFGWMPGIGPKLKDAAKSFDGWRSNVSDDFDGIISQMQNFQQGLQDNQTTSASTSSKILQDFTNQQKGAQLSQQALDTYTQSVAKNGVQSGQAQAARQQLINDLKAAGVNSSTANTDVANYSKAIATNGVNSQQAQAARQQLITDIFNANQNATQGQTDINNLTTAVQKHGTTSTQYQSARAQLIKDLENAGANAQTATGLVDALTKSIGKIPASKNINLHETATGTWTVSQQQAFQNPSGKGTTPVVGVNGYAAGGPVEAGSSAPKADDVLARVSRGEYVVQTDAVEHYGTGLMDAINAKRFAGGGLVDAAFSGTSPSLLGSWMDTVYNQTVTATEKSLEGIVGSYISKAMSQFSASYGTPAGGYSTGTGGLPANYAAIVNYLVAHGFTKVEAAGIAGNIEAESGGNPSIWEIGGGGGYGLIQWTPPPPGLVGSGLTGELQQIASEGTGMFSDPATPAEAAYQYLVGREKPADPGATAGARESSANAVAKAMGFANGGVIPEPVVGLGVNTGRPYTFAENGPETVVPGAGGAAPVVNNYFTFTGTQHPTPEQQQAMLMQLGQQMALA
jgi:hypothetical protein